MAYQKTQCPTCGQWYWQGDAHTCPPTPQQVWQPLPPPPSAVHCPKCGSAKVLVQRAAEPWQIACLGCLLLPIILLILPFLKTHYTCLDCGLKW